MPPAKIDNKTKQKRIENGFYQFYSRYLDADKRPCFFPGATVHDMFNWMCVIVLLPLELIVDGITGNGGYLYHLSEEIVKSLHVDGDGEEVEFLDAITKPLTKKIVKVIKSIHNHAYTSVSDEAICLPLLSSIIEKNLTSSSVHKAKKMQVENLFRKSKSMEKSKFELCGCLCNFRVSWGKSTGQATPGAHFNFLHFPKTVSGVATKH